MHGPAPHRDRQEEARREASARLADFLALEREEIPAWQRERLAASLSHALACSPFYRRLDVESPIRPEEARETLAGLPFTTKDDLRQAYPFGLLAVPRQELCRYGESTGTTGPPTSSFFTVEDWMAGNVGVERALQPFFGPGDLVFVAIPYELTFASYDLDRALERLGATVVPVGALNDVCPFERTARMLQDLHPTGIVCTPTRALRFFDLIRNQGGDPRGVGLRTLLYVGETCSPARLARIAELWGIELVSAYGSTETNSLALPCRQRRLHLAEDRYLFEVVDPAAGEPVAEGARGELVLTSLASRAMPLLRYRTGDLVTLESAACPCGDRRRVLRHHGRVDDRFQVDGVGLLRIDLEEVILSTPGTGLYYVAAADGGGLRVWVECSGAAAEPCCRRVEGRLRERFAVPVAVEAVDHDVLAPALDRMLKPGGLQLEQVESLLEGRHGRS